MSKRSKSFKQKKGKETSTVTDNEETPSLDNQSENTPLGVRKHLDLIDGRSIQFPETLTSGEAPELGDAGEDPETSFMPEINEPAGFNSEKPPWEQKLDLLLNTVNKISKRVSKIEKTQDSIRYRQDS